jgi:hypothetical protein
MDPVKILINKVAKDLNLNVGDVEKAYKAPFELQAIVMKYRCDRETQTFPSLRIPYFLIFYCPPWRKKSLKKLQEKQQRDEDNRSDK